jgi:hypothetical protein
MYSTKKSIICAHLLWPSLVESSRQTTPLLVMDLVDLTPAHPLNMSVPPPNLALTPAELYNLSDHNTRAYPRELLVGVLCLFRECA